MTATVIDGDLSRVTTSAAAGDLPHRRAWRRRANRDVDWRLVRLLYFETKSLLNQGIGSGLGVWRVRRAGTTQSKTAGLRDQL